MKFDLTGCIVDVGANHGDFCLPAASKNPHTTVIAFEPNPELCSYLDAKAEELGLRNLEIRNEAISTNVGVRKLNLATRGDQGVSSLMEFNLLNIRSDPYWTSRSDLAFETQIEVQTVRLDEAISNLGFESVRFLKIDAQGLDLDVLDSARGLRVDSGMLEVPTTPTKALYEGEPCLFEALKYLGERKFKVWDIKPNDPASAEVNVFFSRETQSLRVIESELGLLELDVYSGKNYWFNPSSSPNPLATNEPHAHETDFECGLWEMLERAHEEIAHFKRVSREAEFVAMELEGLASIEQMYRQKYEEVINSRTWRITRLPRLLAGLFKLGKTNV